jgi:hypothetical protein
VVVGTVKVARREAARLLALIFLLVIVGGLVGIIAFTVWLASGTT